MILRRKWRFWCCTRLLVMNGLVNTSLEQRKLELRELEKQAFFDLAKRTLQGQDRLSWLAYLQSKVHFYLPNLDELSEGCIHSAGKQDLLLHPAQISKIPESGFPYRGRFSFNKIEKRVHCATNANKLVRLNGYVLVPASARLKILRCMFNHFGLFVVRPFAKVGDDPFTCFAASVQHRVYFSH